MKKRNNVFFTMTCFVISLLFSWSLNAQMPKEMQGYSNIFSGISNTKSSNKTLKSGCNGSFQNRTPSGACNNHTSGRTNFGKRNEAFHREVPSNYSAGGGLAGIGRKSPREISNIVSTQTQDIPNARGVSAFMFAFLQFLDHNLTATRGGTVFTPISVPAGDIITTIPFVRSANIGTMSSPEQENLLTAWLDGVAIYGETEVRADWLRTMANGKLKTSNGGTMLPCNTIGGDCNAAIDPSAPDMGTDVCGKFFVAGDARANENPALTAIHTIFVLEHNRICDELILDGMVGDELIYQTAKRLVSAKLQAITYNEVLPALGIDLDPYTGYKSNVKPDISNLFATAAFRLGHTMVPSNLMIINDNCSSTIGGAGTGLVGNNCNNPSGFSTDFDRSIPIRSAFFEPFLLEDIGIEAFLKGLSVQSLQEIDVKVVEDLRSFLFGPPGSPGLDLVAINIQRGRDHGLDDYNTIRNHFLGTTASSFADITSDATLQAKLQNAFNNNINEIDVFIGLLAEDHLPGSSLGPTLHAILKESFERIRDADRLWFEIDPSIPQATKNIIRNTTMKELIENNTNLTTLQNNVFFVEACGPQYCTPNYPNATTHCYTFISQVGLNGTTVNSTNTTGNYEDHTSNVFTIDKEGTFTLSFTVSSCNNPGNVDAKHNVWIDWNQDGIFSSLERIYTEDNWYTSNETKTVTFSVPSSAMTGFTRMRIRTDHHTSDSYDACTENTRTNGGETEDYTIQVNSHCLPTHSTNSCDMRISNVVLSTLSNNTGLSTTGGYYQDRTDIFTTIKKGEQHTLSVELKGCGLGHTGEMSVWVDWNQNGIFNSDELVHTSSAVVNGGYASFSPIINIPFNVPIDALEGDATMRIRFGQTATPDPCNNYTKGETEDYTIEVQSCTLAVSNISGDATVLANSTKTYTVSNIPTAIYNWTVTNGTITSGQGTNTITVSWAMSGGQICVEPVLNGCVSFPTCLNVSIDDSQYLSLDVEKTTSINGQMIEVAVSINNGVAFSAFNLGVQWDHTILSFVEVEHLGFDQTQGFYSETYPTQGRMDMTWFGVAQSIPALPNGSNLFVLRFNVIGQLGDISPVNIVATNQGALDFTDNNIPVNNITNIVTNNGWVGIEEGMGTTTLLIGTNNEPIMNGGVNFGTTEGSVPVSLMIDPNSGSVNTNLVQGKTYDVAPFVSNSGLVRDNDITVFDIISSIKVYFNDPTVTVPEIIATDMNEDENISLLDIVTIINHFLNDHDIDYRFINHKWLPTSSQPFNFSEGDTLSEVANFMLCSFTAIKKGDVSGASNIQLPIAEQNQMASITMPEVQAISDYVYVPIQVNKFNNLSGFQYGLNWDTTVLEYVNITSPQIGTIVNASNIDDLIIASEKDGRKTLEELGLIIGDSYVNKGELLISGYHLDEGGWYLDSLSTMAILKFKVIGHPGDTSLIQHSSNLVYTEMITVDNTLTELQISPGKVIIPSITSDNNLIELENKVNIFPNPFQQNTTIQITITSVNDIEIVIYDSIGKEVFIQTNKNVLGTQNILFNGTGLSTGFYSVRIKVGNDISNHKLLLIE